MLPCSWREAGEADALQKGVDLGDAFTFLLSLSHLVAMLYFIFNHFLKLRLLKLLGCRDSPF